MKRALRSTAWSPDLEPVTLVAVEDDLREGLTMEEIVAEGTTLGDPVGVFSVVDVFEVEDTDDVVAATLIAVQRAGERQERERDMAIFYYYDAMMMGMARDDAVLTQTKPSPLTVEEVGDVLRRLVKHPDYRKQTIIAIAEDWTIVKIEAGGEPAVTT